MNRLLYSRQLLTFIRQKGSHHGKRPRKKKVALLQDASDKIKMWQTMLKDEIETHLSTTKAIKDLVFKSFTVDPHGGNLVELYLPQSVRENLEESRHYFRRGAWVDLIVGDKEFEGFISRLDNETVQLRIKDVPPSSIYDQPKITVSLPDDRFVMDFLLELWSGEDWRKMPGVKNFLGAHYSLPLTFGRPRGQLSLVNKNLNKSQIHAVDLAMHPAQTLLTIQGPPGTGKTDVVAEIVLQYYRNSKNVLVLAPSNKAVDNVAHRVYGMLNFNHGQFKLNHNDINEPNPFALQTAINSHKKYSHLETVCGKSSDFWDHEKIGRIHSYQARDLYDSICTDIIGKANVIYSTFTAASLRKLRTRKFRPDVVVIDEAGQANECLAWFGILQAPKAIIVGDQNQLGPVIRSEKAMEANFDKSVMTYLFEQFGNNVQTRLKTQYRANEKIMMWSNEMFYENELDADESVRFIGVEDILEPGSNCYTSPLVMLDTLNAPGNFHERRSQTSFTNYGEAKLVEEQVRGLIAGGINPRQIGVISPYRSQVRVIKELLFDIPELQISSVDAFQGRECEVICMSLVRSRRDNIELGFLTDLRRMNVSITRAKRQFFLVANSDTMKESKELSRLLEIITEHGTIIELSKKRAKQVQKR